METLTFAHTHAGNTHTHRHTRAHTNTYPLTDTRARTHTPERRWIQHNESIHSSTIVQETVTSRPFFLWGREFRERGGGGWGEGDF